jgi:hypothetical protein
MAFRLTRADGRCCSCEELDDPCHCTEPISLACRHVAGSYTLAIALSCSTRTGTATLCGHSEFTTPSTPPRKFRRKAASGTIVQCLHSDASCVSPAASSRYVYAGTCDYDSTTCATANSLSVTQYNGASSCTANTFVSTTALGCDFGDGTTASANCNRDTVVSSTNITVTCTAACCPGAGNLIETGGRTISLSNEDTEAQARTRSSPSAWSAFTACGGLPCCEAYATDRGAGVFTLSYQDARLKTDYSGLGAGMSFALSVEVDYVPIGGGTLADFTTLQAALVADGAGAGTHTFDMPTPPSGFSYFAVDYSVELTSTPTAPETWATCVGLVNDWAGQEFVRGTGVLTYNFAQRRARWLSPVVGVTRTVRFSWERTVYGAGAWSDFGYTDVSVTGVAGPAESWTNWVNVPNELGFQTRLKEARMLPL